MIMPRKGKFRPSARRREFECPQENNNNVPEDAYSRSKSLKYFDSLSEQLSEHQFEAPGSSQDTVLRRQQEPLKDFDFGDFLPECSHCWPGKTFKKLYRLRCNHLFCEDCFITLSKERRCLSCCSPQSENAYAQVIINPKRSGIGVPVQ